MVNEGPILPEGSGDEESPAWLQRQLEAYARGLEAAFSDKVAGARKVRRAFRDYTAKNCEEAWPGGRTGRSEADDGLGR